MKIHLNKGKNKNQFLEALLEEYFLTEGLMPLLTKLLRPHPLVLGLKSLYFWNPNPYVYESHPLGRGSQTSSSWPINSAQPRGEKRTFGM